MCLYSPLFGRDRHKPLSLLYLLYLVVLRAYYVRLELYRDIRKLKRRDSAVLL